MRSPTLATFKCCPQCASTRLAASSGKSIKCASCGLELFLNPAAAVGIVISTAEGRILVLRRAKDPGKGKLGVPGGFIDAFEAADAAIRREVKEETGLTLPAKLDYLCCSTNLYHYAGVDYVSSDLYFHVRMEKLEGLAPLDETEATLLVDPAKLSSDEFAFLSSWHAVESYLKTFAHGK